MASRVFPPRSFADVVANPSGMKKSEFNALLESEVVTIDEEHVGPEEGGAGGSTNIFDDDADIGGDYAGDVIVQGTATVTSDLYIEGDLFVDGDLINEGGHGITIQGNLKILGIWNNATPANSGSQNNCRIRGNCIVEQIEFQVNAGESPEFEVYGDLLLIDNGSLMGWGKPGAQGLTVIVQGNLNGDDVDLHGGDSDGATPAGNGGNLYVTGNCYVEDDLLFYGGNGTNAASGNGGEIEVGGALTGRLNGSGGSGTGADGGVGGEVFITGNAVCFEILLDGGGCNSDDPTHRANIGGEFECGGSFFGVFCSATGGHRTGTVGAHAQTVDPPHGGGFEIHGPCTVDDVNVEGGSIDLGANPNSNGGNGGSFICENTCTASDIQAAGGSTGDGKTGGEGGLIRFGGFASFDDADANGGDAANGNAGSGGFVFIEAGCIGDRVDITDGAAGAAATNGVEVQIGGNCIINTLNLTDRAASRIIPFTAQVMLKVGGMLGKTTLSDGSTESASVAGHVEDSIFIFHPISGWQRITGEAI